MTSAGHLLKLLNTEASNPIRVTVVGAGASGISIVRQIAQTPGMRVALVVTRSPERAKEAQDACGNTCKVVNHPEDIRRIRTDIVVEATGDVEIGTAATLAALMSGQPVLSYSSETDALLGYYFSTLAKERGLTYGCADGDQPGVILRLMDEAIIRNFDIRGIFNCKTFLDRSANPDSVAQWVGRYNSSRMTTSFTDGTKLNLEMNVVANATGFMPLKRGMTGIKTTLATAADDIIEQIGERSWFVDYTLEGDFQGGVFLLCKDKSAHDSGMLNYFKMGGKGPWRIFYRPYHMGPVEVPLSIAEAIFFPRLPSYTKGVVARTVAVAKKPMLAGTLLDGIGGYCLYGQIATEYDSKELLPISLAHNARLLNDVSIGEVIHLAYVDLYKGNAYSAFLKSQS